MRLKDIDVKELSERFEDALNRAQRIDRQERIRIRKKIRNELFTLQGWELASADAIINRWEDRLADVFRARPYGFKEEIAAALTERLRSPLLAGQKKDVC